MTDRRHIVRLLAGLCLSAAALAAPSDATLADWRAEAARVSQLAHNDAPAALTAVETLAAALPAAAPPADRVRLLALRARVEAYLAQTESAARHADEARELALRHGDRIGQAEANLVVMLNAVNEGRIDKVRKASEETLPLLEGADRPDLLVEAMLRAASLYIRHGQVAAALTLALQTEAIAERAQNPQARAYAQQGLAIAYALSNAPDRARAHYARMVEHARAAQSLYLEAFALTGLAQETAAQSDLDTAGKLIDRALVLVDKTGMPFSLNHIRFSKAALLRQQGRHRDAIQLLDATIATYQRHPNKIGLWWVLHARAGDLLALGRLDAAEHDATEAQALARKIEFPLYLAESGKRLAAVAAARGEHQRAYALRAEADVLTRRAEQEKASEIILAITERFQSEAKQRQIDALQQRERRQEIEFRWLTTLLAASLTLLAVTGYFLLRLRRSRTEIQTLNANLEQRVRERTDELRQQTRYLRTLIDTLPVRVWLKDTEGRYLTVNNPEAAIDGRDARVMVGKTDLELWPGEVGAAHRAADLAVMETRRPLTAETVWSDGERQVWMEIDKAPVIDEDGTPLGTVGVARDIGERRAAEKMREEALAAAVRLARLRGDFLARMSHELRTPLNGILGHAQILLRDSALAERQRAAIDVIRAGGEHLASLIDDILDIARIEAGKLELVPDDVPLAELLHVVGEIVAVNARQKDLAFACELAADLPARIRTDGKRLRQVLLNLLSNAVKFTATGQVALSVDRPAPARLRFFVRDSGVGIPADKLELIFQPFEQAGDARQRGGGTGLGLAISRQLVRLMGGDIGVDSQPGAGCAFWFEIDAPEIDAAGIPAVAPQTPAREAGVPTQAALVAPPPEEIETLHRLALAGNMRDIRRQAGHIAALDPVYIPFADHLRQLAGNYQSKAILAFIERHRHDPTD